MPRHDPKEKQIFVYGGSWGRDDETGSVHIAVTWIVTSNDEVPFRSLVAASREYDLGRYDAAVVPANVAVEASLGSAISDWLCSFSGKKRVKDFLSDAATYSHQLNILLPIVCHTIGLRPMPETLRGARRCAARSAGGALAFIAKSGIGSELARRTQRGATGIVVASRDEDLPAAHRRHLRASVPRGPRASGMASSPAQGHRGSPVPGEPDRRPHPLARG